MGNLFDSEYDDANAAEDGSTAYGYQQKRLDQHQEAQRQMRATSPNFDTQEPFQTGFASMHNNYVYVMGRSLAPA